MFSLTRTRFDRDLDRVFNEVFSGTLGKAETRGYSPAVDLTENEDAYLVRAELPGVDGKDIELDFEKDVLTIRGEKRTEQTGESEGARWIESRYGAFSRSVRLGTPVDAEKIEARLENGVLFVSVPKAEQAKPRKIEIRTSNELPNA